MPKERARPAEVDAALRARLMLLVKAVQELAGARCLDEVVSTLRATTRAAIGADGIAIVLRDGEHSHYVAEDAVGKLWTGQRFPLAECISGRAMLEGALIAIPDIYADPRVPYEAYRKTFVASMAAAPIGVPQASAALCAYWAKKGPICEEVLQSLQTLAGAAANAIENGRLFERLLASERRFRTLFELCPVGIAIYNAETRVVPDVNEAMLGIAGMTRREFESGAWDFVRATAPEFVPIDALAREQIQRTGAIRPYEKAFLHRDGKRVPALMAASALDADSGATIVVAQDLTAVKAAEAALATSEAMLRGITDTVREAFYTMEWRETGPKVAYISAAFEEIWGRSRESLVEAPMSFLDAIHPEDRPRVEEAVERQRAGHETETEYRIADPAGRQKWIFDRAYPVIDEDGRVVRTIGVAEDITARKHTEMRAELIAKEMDHRARNLMTIVRGIVGQTLRSQNVAPEVTEALLGRLAALSAAHKAIMRQNYTSASLAELVALALEPFSARTARIAASGPDCELVPQIGLILALALHELATNAMKHGALSVPAGTVTLGWEHVTIGDAPAFRLTWRERGGPLVPAARPKLAGFGTNLLEQGLTWYGGETRLDFAPEGLTATLSLPLALNPEGGPEAAPGLRAAA
ncbi:PAS domain S-box protein [Erythrobacter sp. NE805]|uniref:PAS domain S-box protein n=1 Tax=Erythrobacter sp. NE805 TaxID=3389875 RepID=UPI00396B1CB9